MIFNSTEQKEYIILCRCRAKYIREKLAEPDTLMFTYYEQLKSYRNFLDKNNMRMPSPKYPYNSKDVSTWRYLPNGEINMYWKYAYAM